MPASGDATRTNMRKRTKGNRKRRLPVLNVSDETEFCGEMDSREEVCEVPLDVPGEHLLSDHTTIDILLLDREMKDVLTGLENLGYNIDDEYSSLALTAEEEEKFDDGDGGDDWPALALCNKESTFDLELKESRTENKDDGWEVLSAADSVWTVDSFMVDDAKSFRDVLLESRSSASSALGDCLSSVDPKRPSMSAVGVPDKERGTRGTNGTKSIMKFEMLENADIWASIRDSIKNLGGGKERLRFKGNQKDTRGNQWATWDQQGAIDITRKEQREIGLRCRVYVNQASSSKNF